MYYYYYYTEPVKIRFRFSEKAQYNIGRDEVITVEALSSFLYDLNLLHDCLVLSTIPEYSNYNFSQFFYYSKGRPVKKEHKLYLNKINHNSPLGLEVIIPLAASVAGIPWLILQSVQKIQNWKLDRRKLELEVDKAELDAKEKRIKVQNEELKLEELMQKRNAINTLNRILKRISDSPFIGESIEIDFIEPDKD